MDDDRLITIFIGIGLVIGWLLGSVVGVRMYKSSLKEGKFCPECGAHYSETDLYCTNDGTELLIVGGN